jgi:hypothetical protein
LIDLDSIDELDGGFAILACTKVALAALEIFLLAHVGIARASYEPGRD